MPVPSSASRIAAKPPGSSFTSRAMTSVTLTAKPFRCNSRRALSVSSTMRRRMPNSRVSASEQVWMLMSALASSRHGALSAPGLFSKKMESCLIFIGSPFPGLQDAFVEDAFGLTFAALQRARRHQFHGGMQAGDAFDGMRDAFLHLFHGAHGVAERVGRHFHLHFQRVEIVLPVHDDLVMRQRAFHLEQRGLD